MRFIVFGKINKKRKKWSVEKMTIPHCYRFNKILNRCSLKECKNKKWLKTNKHSFLGHYMRVNNLQNIEDAKKAREYDLNIQFNESNNKRKYNKIRDSILSKQPRYYVEKIPASYSPYMSESFHDTYVVYKETCRKDNHKYKVKTEVARFDDVSSANQLCNQLQSTNPLIKEIDIKKYQTCPDCGSELIEKQGKYGLFIGCSDYPYCNYSRKEWSEI